MQVFGLGGYTPIKGASWRQTLRNLSLLRNVAAGSLSGAIAAAAANPMDLIKDPIAGAGQPLPLHLPGRQTCRQNGWSWLAFGMAPLPRW